MGHYFSEIGVTQEERQRWEDEWYAKNKDITGLSRQEIVLQAVEEYIKRRNEKEAKDKTMGRWVDFSNDIQNATDRLDDTISAQGKDEVIEAVLDAIEILIVGLCKYKGKLNVRHEKGETDV